MEEGREERLNFLRGKDVMIIIGSEFFRKTNKTYWEGTFCTFVLPMCWIVPFVVIFGQHC